MKSILTTITQRGQVTLPAEIRRALKVKPRDRVAFEIDENNAVKVTPAPYTLEQAFGSVKPKQKPENFKKLAKIAKDEHAKKSVRI